MALPIIILSLLLMAAIVLLIIGVFNWANEKGIAFIPLSGIVFLLTGALVWTTGLELNQVASINTATEIITYTYTTITVTDGSPLWIFSNILLFGGFLLILMGFAKIMEISKARNYDYDLDV